MARQISPSEAAKLADEIYLVNSNEDDYQLFLKNKLFDAKAQSSLVAKVGGRFFLSAKDGFGLCVKGSGDYKDDIFLIFRGTTEANNRADWLTDANAGLTTSATGQVVHVGFNRTFNSMLDQIKTFLREHKSTGTVHCIGHSLGGAVASLAADWLKKKRGKSVKLYTFGAPRVGTYFFSVILVDSHQIQHNNIC